MVSSLNHDSIPLDKGPGKTLAIGRMADSLSPQTPEAATSYLTG
jgi:hypothetical protein